MAPPTLPTLRPHTPERENTRIQYATPKKSAFFSKIDLNAQSKPFAHLCAELQIFTRTGYRWLEERRQIGSPACRRSRQRSQILGRKSRVSKLTCKFLVSNQNQYRDQTYECQIEKYNIPIKKRALQTQLKNNTNKGQRYKMAYTKKVILVANKQKRVKYCTQHKSKSVEDFWYFIFFINEAYMNLSLCKTESILRERRK